MHGPPFEKDVEGDINTEVGGDHVNQLEDRSVVWAERGGRTGSSSGNFLLDQRAAGWRSISGCSQC